MHSQKNVQKILIWKEKVLETLKAVIKGIDSRIDTEEIISELKKINFNPRCVTNIRNNKNEMTSIFIIEIEPASTPASTSKW